MTKRQRKKMLRAGPLLAAGVTGAPEVEALLRGEQTNALLMALAGGNESSPGWKHAHLTQSEVAPIHMRDGAYVGGGIRIAALPGSRVYVDRASAARYGRVGPVEIAVDDDGSLRVARVSSPDEVAASVYRYAAPLHDERHQHGFHLAHALHSRTGREYCVVLEEPGGRGVDGDELTDVLLETTGGDGTRLQMVQLDAGLAQSLGQHSIVVNHKISSKTIRDAIRSKVPFAGKGGYDLVLTCPFDLGPPFRDKVASEVFNLHGWRRVWLSDASGEPLLLADATSLGDPP